VTLSPGGELELVHWRDDEARWRLHRGGLLADVASPPAVAAWPFVVEVGGGDSGDARAAVTSVDRSGRFEVIADRADEVAVSVQRGTVTVAAGAREVWLP